MADENPAIGRARVRDQLGDDTSLADAGVAPEQHGLAGGFGAGIESRSAAASSASSRSRPKIGAAWSTAMSSILTDDTDTVAVSAIRRPTCTGGCGV